MFLVRMKRLRDVTLDDRIVCSQQVHLSLLRKLPDTSEFDVIGQGYAYLWHMPTVQLEWREASC
jgi:hypothetical protein